MVRSPRSSGSLAALCLLCAGPAVGLAPRARAEPILAVNGHNPSASDLDGMVALGAVAVRVDFNWFQFEPTSGTFDFSVLDPIVQGANQRGLAVDGTIAYTPQWASSVPTCTQSAGDNSSDCNNKVPANSSDWTTAVSTVASRYAGQVDCWSVWNEPNLGTFFDGTEDDFVNDIFVPAAAAIRAADPSARICGPELAGLTASSNWNGSNGTCLFGSCIRNGWELDLGDMLTRVGDSFDVITQHMYEADAQSVVTALLDGQSVAGLLVHDSVKHVIEAHDAGGRPFYLTETGWEHVPQGGNTVADVATQIVELYEDQEAVCDGSYASANAPWPNWSRTYYYHYPYDPGSGWGLIDSDGGPLPPYTALQAWAAGQATSSCGPPPAPDGGSTEDAGVGSDAGGTLDAGGIVQDGDAGSADAGVADGGIADAGAINAGIVDAGIVDAGFVDAGAVDGGGTPRVDAGPVTPDAGATPPLGDGGSVSATAPRGGCSCGQSGEATLWVVAWMAFACGRRRQEISGRAVSQRVG